MRILLPTNTASFWILIPQHNYDKLGKSSHGSPWLLFARRKDKEAAKTKSMSISVTKIERRPDGSLPRMKPGQRKQANALIRKSCCNFDHGNCILLDEACAQMISASLCCKWFRWAVLPQDTVLENSLIGSAEVKRCTECGRPFVPNSNRGKYCPDCAFIVHRRQKTESERKRRSGVDN